MATASVGISVSFKGTAIAEVVSLSWNYGGSIPKGRGVAWSEEMGSVTLEAFGVIPGSQWGESGTLSISGGGMTVSGLAVCKSVGAAAEVNGVTRYTATYSFIG